MGVQSDGSYGVEPGLFFGFPTRIDSSGRYHIVTGLTVDSEIRYKINEIAAALSDELKMAIEIDDSLPPLDLDSLLSSANITTRTTRTL